MKIYCPYCGTERTQPFPIDETGESYCPDCNTTLHRCEICDEHDNNIICTACAEFRLCMCEQKLRALQPHNIQNSKEVIEALSTILFFNYSHE